MRTLTLSTDNFDTLNTFNVNTGRGGYPAKCSLRRDYAKVGDGVLWCLQHCGVIAASYSPAEIAERDRLNSEPALQSGELVQVTGYEGQTFRVKVLGNYSNAAILEPVA